MGFLSLLFTNDTWQFHNVVKWIQTKLRSSINIFDWVFKVSKIIKPDPKILSTSLGRVQTYLIIISVDPLLIINE